MFTGPKKERKENTLSPSELTFFYKALTVALNLPVVASFDGCNVSPIGCIDNCVLINCRILGDKSLFPALVSVEEWQL